LDKISDLLNTGKFKISERIVSSITELFIVSGKFENFVNYLEIYLDATYNRPGQFNPLFESNLIKDIQLVEKGFNFCPEITAKVSQRGVKIFEVPISYKGRTHKEGKKIKFIDGFKAIKTIIYYNLFKK
jgi:hypothetical protein